jgi:hypothetical protein
MRVGDSTHLLLLQCEERGLPTPVLEFRFCIERKWRADRGWPEQMVIAEIDGGSWLPQGGRHTRGKGFENDCIKLNTAAILGYRVLRFTPAMVQSGIAIAHIEQALA